MSKITLPTEGISKENYLFCTKIYRKDKSDKSKMYNISEKSIIIDTNKKFNNLNSVRIKSKRFKKIYD